MELSISFTDTSPKYVQIYNGIKDFILWNQEQKSVVSKIGQLVLANFIALGLFDKHLAKMRTIYRKKQQALLSTIRTHFSKEFQVIGKNSGLHIVMKLPARLTEATALQKALTAGIQVYLCSTSFQYPTGDAMILFGYGG